MEFLINLLVRSRKEVQVSSPGFKEIAVINEPTNEVLLLNKTGYFGWIVGLLPVTPKSIKTFQSRTWHFNLYCAVSILTLSFVMYWKSLTILHISKTRFNTTSDKLNDYLSEMAALISDCGIRLGFLLRSVECVLLFKGIQEYKREFSPTIGQNLSHKILKYGSLLMLNFVYVTWIIGLGLRKLKFINGGDNDLGNLTVTFFPSLESNRNLYISDIVCQISSILSSYYIIFLIISISVLLLDFLDDFHVKLKSDIELQGTFQKFDGFSRRGSNNVNVTQDEFRQCHSMIDAESKKSILKLDIQETLESTIAMKVNHRQLTCLTTLFRQFNQAVGLSLVASVFADLLMIVSIMYSLISAVLDAEVLDLLGIINNGSFSSVFISASEAEYEARICIIAVIGSYVVHKMKTYKTELEELFYSCEKPATLMAATPVRGLYERFKDWKWSLDGLDIFTINLPLVCSMTGTVTTYVIVLLQVKMSEK